LQFVCLKFVEKTAEEGIYMYELQSMQEPLRFCTF